MIGGIFINTIIINKNIMNTVEHDDTYETLTIDDFCFQKFKIVYPEYKTTAIIELNNGTKSGKAKYHFGIRGSTISVEWDFENYEYDFEESQGIKNNCVKPDKKVFDEQGKYEYFIIVQEVLDICHYIMTTKRNRVTKTRGENLKIESAKSKKNKYSQKVYLLDEIVEYVNENGLTISPIGTHKINCPCWSVRGHYRHYKSGKVVFVKEHKKGKDRANEQPKDKTYTV